MVEVVINQSRIKLSLSQFKELLFRDEKTPKKRQSKKIDSVLSDKEYLNKYGYKLLKAFVDYWTEQSVNGNKMRYQKEKEFDISRRLKTWAKNQKKWHSPKAQTMSKIHQHLQKNLNVKEKLKKQFE